MIYIITELLKQATPEQLRVIYQIVRAMIRPKEIQHGPFPQDCTK